MATLRLRLLGEMELARGEAAIALPQSKKTRALLAYLAVTGRSHRRTRLCDLLWETVDDPRGALRWSLSKLRPLLNGDGTERLAADRDSASLDPVDMDVDVLRLRRHLAGDLGALATDALEAVADAFRGELLEGLEMPDAPSFHAWCVAQREELRALHGRVLAALVARLADDPGRALPRARALVELDRQDDRARAAMLRLLAAAGRTREAEESYEAHKHWLAERGERPGPILVQAWHGIQSGSERAGHLARAEAPPQEIRFCTMPDGVQIAYATVGSGPPLVKTANWLNHLEYDWQSPVWRHYLAELARQHQVLRYDQRGNGLSDRGVEDLSLDAFARDLDALIEQVGLERYPLLGISQGCAVAVRHAARHPDRVSHLVLLNGFACGWRVRDKPRLVQAGEALCTLAAHGWGQSHPAFRQVFTSLMMPDAPADYQTAYNELQRRTASAEDAVRLIRAFGEFDARCDLPEVRVPTLVLHSRHDGLIPFSEGRAMAAAIPGAKFVPLESRSHALMPDEPAWERFVSELRSFLG